MKMKNFLFVAFSLFLLLSCSCAGCKQCTAAMNHPTNKEFTLTVDDSVKHLLGDSIADIIFEADSVILLELSVNPPKESVKNDRLATDSVVCDSLIVDSIAKPMLHGAYIVRDFGTLSEAEITPILLILSDRSTYYPDGVRVKSPFIPDVALCFTKAEKRVDAIFSFTGGHMYIIHEDGTKSYFKYDYERLILLYFQQHLQNENITQFLNLNLF